MAPTVRARQKIARTWHQSSSGNLCLYGNRDGDYQPWRDPRTLLERIDLWFKKNEQGWPDDPPALDIEAYLDLALDHRYVLYDDLVSRGDGDGYVIVRPDNHLLHVVGPGKVPKRSSRGLLSGYVADLGELTAPPKDWADLIADVDRSTRIRSAIDRHRLDLLLIRYHRGRQHGAVAITLTHEKGKGVRSTPRLAYSGSISGKTMRLRSGPTAALIAAKRVYVVGAGALGSHICDGLSRAGIGHLTIRDYDILHPGNLTRHLVTNFGMCGFRKVNAVRAVIEGRPYNSAQIDTDIGR